MFRLTSYVGIFGLIWKIAQLKHNFGLFSIFLAKLICLLDNLGQLKLLLELLLVLQTGRGAL